MNRHNCLGLILIALVGLSPVAKAEMVHPGGDGYFCSSKGYLAFDYNQTEIEGNVVKKMHSLKIVRFGPEHRIYFAGEVSLSTEFSILVMGCDGERVEMIGQMWPRGKEPSLAKCDINMGTLTTTTGPANCTGDTGGTYPTKKSPNFDNTSAGNDPHPITLASSADTGYVYQLLRHRTQESEGNRKTEAEVVKIDREGTIVDRLVIYEYVVFVAAD